jgi:hypothetical protein
MMQEVLEAVPGTFGDYASSKDVAPCAIFIAFFASLAIGHGFVFIRNLWAGQKFYASLGMVIYAILKTIGFGLRLKSAKGSLNIADSVVSQIFICLPVLLFDSINCVFGRRVFSWRHPENGSSRATSFFFNSLYVITVAIIPMAIIGQTLPYIYFEDQRHLIMCLEVARVAGVMQVLYSFFPFSLTSLAYVFPVGSLTENLLRFPLVDSYRKPPTVLQPFWIEKRTILYYPSRNSQFRLFKEDKNGNAVRLISSTGGPANGKSIPVTQETCSGPRPFWIIWHLLFVTAVLIIAQLFRSASTFVYKPRMGYSQPYSSFLYESWPLYLSAGAFELVACLYFLLFRLDLIFYIPDTPLKGKSEESTDFQALPPALERYHLPLPGLEDNKYSPPLEPPPFNV